MSNLSKFGWFLNVVVLGAIGAYLAFPASTSAQAPRPKAVLRGHKDYVEGLAFSPDGKVLASGSWDKTIKLWDVKTGKNTTTLKPAGDFWCCSVAFSPDGKKLAAGGLGDIIDLWDLARGKATTLQNREQQHATPKVVFSRDGKMLATGGRCIEDIKLRDVATGKNTATLKGHSKWGPRAMAFAKDGKTLASVGMGDGTRLWDTSTGKQKNATLKAADRARIEKLVHDLYHGKATEREKAAKELKALGTARLDKIRQAARTSRADARLDKLLYDGGFKGDLVLDAAFSADGKTLAVFEDESKLLKLRDVATGKLQAALKGPEVGSELVFSPDGKRLAFARGPEVKLWDVAANKELATFKGHTKQVWALAFSPDGKTLAFGGEDNTIHLWDLSKLK
jgi:WD40 repeat protein